MDDGDGTDEATGAAGTGAGPGDRPVDRAFAAHGAFDPVPDGYRSTATPFVARVEATAADGRDDDGDGDGDDGADAGGDADAATDGAPGGPDDPGGHRPGGWRFAVTVWVPTLSAAVEGAVGPAVADGWFDTLALRLADAYDVLRAGDPVADPAVSVVPAADLPAWADVDAGSGDGDDADDGANAGEGADVDDDDGGEAADAGDRVRATFAFRARDPAAGVDDAAAVVDFVEGTYVQGVVPGYEYRDPVAGLLARAREAGGDAGGGRGPPPG